MGNKLILKYTAWYKMKCSSKELLSPQAEENIEQVLWVKPKDIPVLLRNSFETIMEVLVASNIL
jgi:hypothetical protein